MNFFLQWVPTFAAGGVMIIIALILRISILRDERRAREARAAGIPEGPGGAPHN